MTSPAASTAPPPEPTDRWAWDQLGRVLVGVALALVALALVVHVSPWMTKGFGVSHDGYNGAMWGLGARGALEAPLDNRLGGIQVTGDPYANHPPLLVWTEAAAAGLGGERPVALRIPVLLASLAGLGLLALLLRDAGCSPPAVAAGIVVAGTTGMFLTYGALIDTPILSLPLGLAALVVAQRSWQDRPPPTWLLIAAGGLAAVSGWQAALVAGFAALACMAAPAPAGRRAGRILALGVAAGAAITLSWVLWSQGSLRKLGSQATLRAGQGTGWSSWFDRQIRFLGDLYGGPILGVVLLGTAVALFLPTSPEEGATSGMRGGTGVRPLVIILGLAVVGYTIGLRQASTVHDYWTYWGVTLVAVTVALLVDGVRRAASTASRPVAAALVAGSFAVVVILAATGAAHRTDADAALQEGLDAVPVLEAASRAGAEGSGAQPLVVRNASETLAPWAEWATERDAEVPTPEELIQLDGDRLLFIQTVDAPTPAVLDLAMAHQGRYVLLRVDDYRTLVGG